MPITLGNSGGSDIFIAKYSDTGYSQWATHISGLNNESGKSITTDNSNNIYVTGFYNNRISLFNSNGDISSIINSDISGNTDGFISKYSDTGYLEWATTIGGIGNKYSNSITTDISNNIYVTGNYTEEITLYSQNGSGMQSPENLGNNNVFIVKYSDTGYIQWIRHIGGMKIRTVFVGFTLFFQNLTLLTSAAEAHRSMPYEDLGKALSEVRESKRELNGFIAQNEAKTCKTVEKGVLWNSEYEDEECLLQKKRTAASLDKQMDAIDASLLELEGQQSDIWKAQRRIRNAELEHQEEEAASRLALARGTRVAEERELARTIRAQKNEQLGEAFADAAVYFTTSCAALIGICAFLFASGKALDAAGMQPPSLRRLGPSSQRQAYLRDDDSGGSRKLKKYKNKKSRRYRR